MHYACMLIIYLLRQYPFNYNTQDVWHDHYFEELIRDVARIWNENKVLPIQLMEMVSERQQRRFRFIGHFRSAGNYRLFNQ